MHISIALALLWICAAAGFCNDLPRLDLRANTGTGRYLHIRLQYAGKELDTCAVIAELLSIASFLLQRCNISSSEAFNIPVAYRSIAALRQGIVHLLWGNSIGSS